MENSVFAGFFQYHDMEFDDAFIRLALEQARLALKMGEVPVGAVITRGEEILSTASIRPCRDPGDPPGGRKNGELPARWNHPLRHPGALYHVCCSDPAGPDQPCCLRCR